MANEHGIDYFGVGTIITLQEETSHLKKEQEVYIKTRSTALCIDGESTLTPEELYDHLKDKPCLKTSSGVGSYGTHPLEYFDCGCTLKLETIGLDVPRGTAFIMLAPFSIVGVKNDNTLSDKDMYAYFMTTGALFSEH